MMNATSPIEPQTQDASSDYPGNGKRKVFQLAPVEDDLTFTILNVRLQALEDRDLDDGAKILFVYLLDKSLNRNVNEQPGVVTISQTKLREKLGRSERTIFEWKRQLVQKGFVWMTRRYMPNTWPIDTYHIAAIHPPNHFERKTTSDGLWGNGDRRVMINPPQGARRPGQLAIPLPGSLLPGRKKDPGSAKTPDFSGGNRSQLPPSPEAGFRRQPKQASADNRSRLPAATEAGFRRQPKQASGGNRSRLPAATEAGFRHREGESRGKSALKGEGSKAPRPPDDAFEIWIKGLEGMFPSKLRRLETDLKQRLASARSREAKAEWQRRLAVVQERLLGGRVTDDPKAKPVKVAPPAIERPLTKEEIAEGAHYLVSIGKENLLTKQQREALR